MAGVPAAGIFIDVALAAPADVLAHEETQP